MWLYVSIKIRLSHHQVKGGTITVDQLPHIEVGGLFLPSVVKRLKADSLPKDSVCDRTHFIH